MPVTSLANVGADNVAYRERGTIVSVKAPIAPARTLDVGSRLTLTTFRPVASRPAPQAPHRAKALEGRSSRLLRFEPASGGVSFVDSTMLRILLSASTRANERGTGFALIRPNALVWGVFVLTKLSDCFLSYSSSHEALRDVEQRAPCLLVSTGDGAVLAEFDSEEASLEVIELIRAGELPARGVAVVKRDDVVDLSGPA